MNTATFKILMVLICSSAVCFAQKSKMMAISKTQNGHWVYPELANHNYNYYHLLNDSIFILILGGACKNRIMIVNKQQLYDQPIDRVPMPGKIPLVSIGGNILYNFNYRSYIDTPFEQRGMVQHTVQTFMNCTVADKYPFRAIFTYRGSNSPYFSNTSDVSIQYKQSDMIEKVKADLRKDADSLMDKNLLVNPSKKYETGMSNKTEDSLLRTNPFTKGLYQKFDSLYAQYENKRKELEVLQKQKGNQNLLQALVEAREAKLFKKENHTVDSVADSSYKEDTKNIWAWTIKHGESSISDINQHPQPKDSTRKSTHSSIDTDAVKIKKIQDSIIHLKEEVADAEKKILSFQKHLTDSVKLIKRKINQLNDPESLTDYMDKNDTTERNRLTQVQKFLLSVDQIGIGRSWVNYSELTVQNISLNGFNIEMNPGNLYVAGAIGSVNSQFRDFILNNNTSTNQSVKLFRIGKGKKNKNLFVFTFYTGRKAMLNSTGLGDSSATQQIMGTSLASTFAIDKNTTATFEYARSSYADAYDPTQLNKGLLSRVLNFKMNTSQAWDIKFQSVYPLTNTKINGDYRQMGAAFQSFTIYPTNVKQDAFLFHANQLLLKKKLSIDASIRKNDFNSPLTAPGYSNTAVFKSFQVSLTIPHYPFVSLGYYPTSQLFSGTNNVIYQSWYNTLNAIASYTYKLAKLNMNANVVYTKFYNNQSDSSFVYFNASSFTLNNTVYVKPFTFQASLTVADQLGLDLTTVEPLVTYQFKNIVSLTGGVKWSRLNGIQTLWGGTAGMSILIKRLGSIQLHYDRVYLPAYNRTLMPVDLGRVTFNREF